MRKNQCSKGSHFLATLWLPWVFELHSLGAKKWSKIATTLIFFQWKLRMCILQIWKKELFLELFRGSIWFWNIKYAFENNFLCIEFKPKYILRKAPKKAPFFKFEKHSLSAFTGRKINIVSILVHFVSSFETNLILASYQLASMYPIG